MKYKKNIIFALIGILFIVNAYYMGSHNPDYESYRDTHFGVKNFQNFIYANDPLYFLINIIFEKLGFEYHQFRIILLFICSLLLFFIIQNVSKLCSDIKVAKANLIYGIFCLSIFYYEFLVIRVRGGIAILLLTYAFLLVLSTKRYIVSAILILIALGTHSLTAPIALAIFGIALLSSYINRIRLSYNLITVGFGFIFIFLMDFFIKQGFGNISPINPARLIMTAIIPLIIFTSISFKGNNPDKNEHNFNGMINNITLIYISIISGLLIGYPLGLINLSGESLLRALYIFQLPFILALLFLNGQYINLITFIACINALFFIRPFIQSIISTYMKFFIA